MSDTKTIDGIPGIAVTVPHLAESLVSATVGKWLVAPGDYVKQYDVICELVTDKVTTEMPSPVEGVVTHLLVKEGVEAAVGEPLCILAGADAANAAQAPASAPSAATGGGTPPTSGAGAMRRRYSPAVLTLAAEHGIRLDEVDIVGTGLDGRITRKDVLAFVASGAHKAQAARPQAASPAPAAAPPAAVHAESARPAETPVRTSGLHLSEEPRIPSIEIEQGNEREYLIDVTPVRSTIASRMRQSVSEIPHAWTMIEADVTNLVNLRNKVKDEFFKREGVNLTYMAFMLKAVVNAIKDYPIMNSVWAVDKIIVKRDINVSLSVGTEDSVMVPVIKQADRKNIAGLAREIDELARKTRAGKLTLSDMQGGTFTVNNTGSFGSILSYPIINYPQAAIITFESIVKRPVVIKDMIAVRSMVNLCLSLDHRILDGVICGRFLQRVKENLESFDESTNLY
ncbi:dihydrolipoamide acetyltransferase family protein [Paenibacillus sp.]|uniref:dihydrolipoamide acetyltransferase family protein n=1 Tax=Paenibacillus sp. TaxID=58172 RepID=UPI002D5FC637|nr:dihydrolipoamide acetyltransferase family protein [Paenibacillus sp.]HZG85154.1 dihydrolipoamide acetyltransferase family protein [Paenibacillus sp.]